MAVTVDWVVLTAANSPVNGPSPVAATGPALDFGGGDGALKVTSLTLTFSFEWPPGASRPSFDWHLEIGLGAHDGDVTGSGGAGTGIGGGLALAPSTITPIGPSLIGYTLSITGPTVTGTAADERIVVGGAGEFINGGGGDDVIVFDPAIAAGADRMVMMDGGPGSDTYRLVAASGQTAALPACLIFDFDGPSVATVSSPDRAVLVGLGNDVIGVTDLGGGFFEFSDGTGVIEAGFHRPDWTPLTLDEIDDRVYVGDTPLSLIDYAIDTDAGPYDTGDLALAPGDPALASVLGLYDPPALIV